MNINNDKILKVCLLGFIFSYMLCIITMLIGIDIDSHFMMMITIVLFSLTFIFLGVLAYKDIMD